MIKTNATEGRRIHKENEVECKAKKPGPPTGVHMSRRMTSEDIISSGG